MNAIGTSVKKLRIQRRASQEDLALAVGVRQSMISAIENGERTPSLELAFKIANYFGVTVDSLYRATIHAEPINV